MVHENRVRSMKTPAGFLGRICDCLFLDSLRVSMAKPFVSLAERTFSPGSFDVVSDILKKSTVCGACV